MIRFRLRVWKVRIGYAGWVTSLLGLHLHLGGRPLFNTGCRCRSRNEWASSNRHVSFSNRFGIIKTEKIMINRCNEMHAASPPFPRACSKIEVYFCEVIRETHSLEYRHSIYPEPSKSTHVGSKAEEDHSHQKIHAHISISVYVYISLSPDSPSISINLQGISSH